MSSIMCPEIGRIFAHLPAPRTVPRAVMFRCLLKQRQREFRNQGIFAQKDVSKENGRQRHPYFTNSTTLANN
jgi:hypothetical protein